MFNLYLLLLFELLFLALFFLGNNADVMAPSVMVSMVFVFSTSIAILNGETWNIEYSFNAFL